MYVWLWKPWLTWHSLSWWAPVEWGGLCSCPRPVSPAGQGDSDRSHTVPAPVDPLCWCTAFWNASVKFSSCLKKKKSNENQKVHFKFNFCLKWKKKKVFCKILEDFSSIIKIIYDFILKYVTCNVKYSFISIHII